MDLIFDASKSGAQNPWIVFSWMTSSIPPAILVAEIGLSYNAAKNNIQCCPIEAPGRVQWFYAREIGRIASAPED
jgi:hypothetical protein